MYTRSLATSFLLSLLPQSGQSALLSSLNQKIFKIASSALAALAAAYYLFRHCVNCNGYFERALFTFSVSFGSAARRPSDASGASRPTEILPAKVNEAFERAEEANAIHTLPNELLLKIFSYLSLSGMAKARRVCLAWNPLGATAIEDACKQLHGPMWEGPPLDPSGSWTKSFRILKRWKAGRACVTEVDAPPTGSLLHGAANRFPSCFDKNNATLKRLTPSGPTELSLLPPDQMPVRAHSAYQNTLTLLHGSKYISCFDIPTGTRTQYLTLDKEDENLQGAIGCNGNEIVFWSGRTIKIWDYQTGEARKPIPAGRAFEPSYVTKLHSTAHHVVYHTWDTMIGRPEDEPVAHHHLVAIRKSDQKADLTQTSHDLLDAVVSGPYLALIDRTHPRATRIRVVKEEGKNWSSMTEMSLEAMKKYEVKATIYRNWFVAADGNKVEVWNLANRTQISTFSLKNPLSTSRGFVEEVHTDGSRLWISIHTFDTFGYSVSNRARSECTYDFSEDAGLPSP